MSNAFTSPISILVVDDNRDAADTLTLLFKVTGHTAHAAYDAVSGMKLIQELEPDLAVFDLDLPDIDGCEALKRLLSESPHLKALFVCLTGRSTREAKQRCMESGFHRFLTKPLSGIEFDALIDFARRRKVELSTPAVAV